ncbi:hypothetical protein [Chloroflexus sp.]|uniref:hypothetical protein n=1 Tax=Chloroflexus sp. TaxID=1904827 RepID=UPI00262AF13E|nr:hypothetical protein [uncultured Chloroflexus sp.]
MHDGYLFTLGICGSADEDDPAPELLSALLGALPPVKRAAFLGVLPFEQPDPLLTDIIADMTDAELIVIVAPATTPQLPTRLNTLLCAATAARINGRYAFIAAIGQHAGAILRQIHTAATACGLIVAGAHAMTDNQPPPLEEVRAAYAIARATLAPDALP